MKILFEDSDYLEATEPFNNGCAFKLEFRQNGMVYLDIGCYCLNNLFTGVKRELYKLWYNNEGQAIPISISSETKAEALSRKPCRWCGSPYFEKALD